MKYVKFYFLSVSHNGYVPDFKMYTGEESTLRDTVYGLVGRFVGQGFHVFMDNYYNSVALAQELSENGIHVSGTLRLSRQGTPEILRYIARYRQMAKGETVFRRNGDVFVILWRSPVRVVSMVMN